MAAELNSSICLSCNNLLVALRSYEGSQDPGELDFLVYQIYRLYRILRSVDSCEDYVLEDMAHSLTLLEGLQQLEDIEVGVDIAPEVIRTQRRGRPRFDIRPDQLEYLLGIGFTCPRIAIMLGVSLRTIRRRMSECGFSVKSLYSTISDAELDSLVKQIQVHFPNCGYRLMHGHLLQGHRVQHHRVRESFFRVDPEGWTCHVNHHFHCQGSSASCIISM